MRWAASQRADFEATLKELVEIAVRFRRSGPSGRHPSRRRPRREQDPRIRRSGRDPRDRGQSARPRPLQRRQERADRHDLQPPRRPAGLARDRAVEDRSVRLHQGGRPLLRPRHDRRQGPRAHRALGHPRRARGGRARQHLHVLWELEEEIGSPNFESGDQRARQEARHRSRPRQRHHLGLAPAPGLPGRAARPAGLRARRWRPARPTSTPARPAARRAIPLGELMQLVSEMYDATTGRVKIKGFYDDVEPPTKRELAGLPRLRLHGQAVQEGPPLQVDPHRGSRRGDEADLGDADVRGPRPRRRLHRARGSRRSSRRARR